jgi:hypothetical protein
VMVVARNGQRATVTWRNDKKKSPDEGSFVIVRVGPPDEGVPRPAPEEPGHPSAGSESSLSPEEEAQLDELYDEVLTSIESLRFSFADPLGSPAPTPRPVVVYGVQGAAATPAVTLPTPAPATLEPKEGWGVAFDKVLQMLDQTIDSLTTQLLDALVEAAAEATKEGGSP